MNKKLDCEMVERDEDPDFEIKEYSSDDILDLKGNYFLMGIIAGVILGGVVWALYFLH